MQIDNLPGVEPGPVDTSAPTEASLIEDIADLLDDDPETDPAESEDQAKAGETDDGDEPEVAIDPEDVDDPENADSDDGPQDDVKGGQFAPNTAKVTLKTGRVISVEELKTYAETREAELQRGFTEKTQELGARRAAVDQQAQSLTQLAERLTVFSQKYLPQPPEPFTGTPDTDPLGYMTYMQQREQYEQAVNEFNGIQYGTSQLTEEQQRQQDEQDRQTWASEAAALVERDKFFADPKKVQAFFEEAVNIGGEAWGLTREDIAGLRSGKAFQVLRDAVRYRKALAKAPEVQKQVQAKPVVAIGGRRANPNSRVTAEKQARSERLRTTGSFEAGVAAIEDLIP